MSDGKLKIEIEIPMETVIGHERHTITLGPDDIAYALYEVCCSEHSSCGYACPVWRANGGQVPMLHGNCACFEDGVAMLAFLRKGAS